jgi:drug/metabolite transporter (DMT)-like permease
MLNTSTTVSGQRLAVMMLLLASVFWGMGFSWAKNVGQAGNASAGLPDGSMLGPVLMLAIRFVIAAILWIAIFPQARRGWSIQSIKYGSMIGLAMGTGLILQHLGLDQASEAVTAFLTNLTVVIVPILVALITFRRPAGRLVVGCLVALGGIYLLTGAGPTGMSAGEWLGIACAGAFSVAMVLMNILVPRDDPFRITFVMFLFCGFGCGVVAMVAPGFSQVDLAQLADDSYMDMGLLIVFSTLGSFGLMLAYQPRVDPTRAAIVYLFEPIVAALYAAAMQDSALLTRMQLVGAGLILLANLVAELQWKRPGRKETDA